MQRERVPLDWIAAALLAVVSLLPAATSSEPGDRIRTPPPHCLIVGPEPADPATIADSLYRHGEAARAADVLDDLGRTDELYTLAQLYRSFASAYATGMDPSAPITDAFDALRTAQSLDIALGGVFAEKLTTRMRAVAPVAAAAFAKLHDAPRMELARHTAEVFRSR